MGRRALPKPASGIDLSRYLLKLEDLEKPLNPAALFGREAPLEVEIGSGKGLFMKQASGDHPERNFLGVEIAGKYARYAAGRLAKRDRANAKMIHGDAERLLAEHLPDGSAAAVHIYFPDPWWKRRHRKRRVMNASLLKNVERVLQSGGALHFWTDVEEYFHTALETIADATDLRGPLEAPAQPAEHFDDYRTNFERRTRLHGKPVYRSEFRKR